MDHFSPVAAAHIRVLVLPVGHIDRARFARFLQRLLAEVSLIPLADVQRHSTSARDGFVLSPSAFPQGSLLCRFSAAVPSPQLLQLSPLELFREPLLVLGIVHGLSRDPEARRQELERATAYLKERHTRLVHRQLVVLHDGGGEETSNQSQAIPVYNADVRDDASLRTAMCVASGRFLVELTTYAKALQASPTIQTPGQTARILQDTPSFREGDKGRAISPQSTEGGEGSPSRSAKPPPLPATSFDQIPSANGASNGVSRSDSITSQGSKGKGHGRNSSQDRISLQGFGSGTSQEKARVRGKARVGIVLGSIYMMAGHWTEALRILTEHTSASRSLSDHLWHAKGLENMLVCMLLLAWAGIDFHIPSLCDPVAEQKASSNATRASIGARLAAEGRQQQIIRLSAVIPDLSGLILRLYRSNEGSLELPVILPAEATIRIAKLLATLESARGILTSALLRPLIAPRANVGSLGEEKSRTVAAQIPNLLAPQSSSKAAIANMLAQALPTNEDGIAAGDQIRLIAGVASVYAMLRLHRKKAITIKGLVTSLTQALIQARKLGAAEMGIHPAASLSMDAGAESVLSLAEVGSGIRDLMTDVAHLYGASVVPATCTDSPTYVDMKSFGHSTIKCEILRELAGFCEASPDPHGVLSLTASLLRAAGPNSAIDAPPSATSNAFSREEQRQYATVISRTIAMSKYLGATDVKAIYWDPFLVRGVEIQGPTGQRAVIDRTKLHVAVKAADQPLGPGNPLLYDPSASRPGTAAKQTYLLIQNEPSECIVTLQNPFDISVDIESLELVTDGLVLACQHDPTTLGPLRYQRVLLYVTPKASGAVKVTGCRISMQGCYPQIFPVITAAWSPKVPLTLKDFELSPGRRSTDVMSQDDLKALGIEPEIISASVIDEIPTLVLENTTVFESGLMLLEGESRSLELILRNTGSIGATVFEATDTSDVLRRDDEHKLKLRGVRHKRSKSFLPTTTVEPGKCISFKFRVEGKANMSSTQANFYYCAIGAEENKHARIVSVPVIMTVNAALQAQHFEVTQPVGSDVNTLLATFDLRNAWPRSVCYESFEKTTRKLEWNPDPPVDNRATDRVQEGQLAPGEIRRIYLTLQYNPDDSPYEEEADKVRTHFLDQIHVSWKVGEHSGYVDLLSLPLSPESFQLIRPPPIHLSLEFSPVAPTISVGTFITIRATLTPKLLQRQRLRRITGPLAVQLSPRTTTATTVVREARKFAVAGTLRRILPGLHSDDEKEEEEEADDKSREGGGNGCSGGGGVQQETKVEFVLCPLLAGPLDFDMVVRPAQIARHVDFRGEKGWCTRRAVSLMVV